jgi:hypothetical protein|nr:MAG TPA: hypothetical protein [Caudoviricetes sp.]
MINKVTYQEEPELFNEITEFSIDSEMDHRRGSNFFREDIIEFTADHKQYFEEVANFEQYIGTWRTNNVIWDDTHGFDSEFSELTRVKKKEVITYEWENVE